MASVPPEKARALAQAAGLSAWSHRPSAARVALEALKGGTRRRQLSPIAREIERTFGRQKLHSETDSLADLVEEAFAGAVT